MHGVRAELPVKQAESSRTLCAGAVTPGGVTAPAFVCKVPHCRGIHPPEMKNAQFILVLLWKIVYNSNLITNVYLKLALGMRGKEGILMLKFHSEQGEITVSSAVFSNITGMAATNCFGVKGMAYRSMTDGLVHLLRREAMSKGVSVTNNEDGSVSIELHIIVENGVNLPAVCRSIMNEVRYVVTKNTGIEVRSVDVCVDSMTL